MPCLPQPLIRKNRIKKMKGSRVTAALHFCLRLEVPQILRGSSFPARRGKSAAP